MNLLNQMLWSAALMSAPILGAILLVGVLISIVQVATQVQEMTLTYVPKLIVVVLLLIFLGSWMTDQLIQFSRAMFQTIPRIAQ